MFDLLKKYHSWIVALVTFMIVAFQYATGITVPDFVYGLLAALGLGSARFTMAQALGVTGWKAYAAAVVLGAVAAARGLGVPIPLQVDDLIITFAGGSIASAARKAG